MGNVSTGNQERRTLAPSIAECSEELSSVAQSRTFQQSPRLIRLLQYLCSNSVFGESRRINEHTIGVDVFAKPPDFKENKDSTVRVEMHRLRRKLSAFYATEGAGHKIRIIISAGNYTPAFQFWPGENGNGKPAPEADPNGDRAVGSLAPEPVTTAAKNPTKFYAIGSIAAIAVLCLVVAAVLYNGRRPSLRAPGAAASPNGEVHILAGYDGTAWTDDGGRRWQPDGYYQGGIPGRGPGDLEPATPGRRLYQTMREGRLAGNLPDPGGTFSYDIPVKPGTYDLRLYFADPVRRSALLQEKEDGQNLRHFDVAVNGQPLLKRFDVVADSGVAAADVRAFKDIQPAADGRVHLQFTPNPNQPFVNALELTPSAPGFANPIRITPRQSVLVDSQGNKWGPDDFFIGGRLIAHPIPADVHLPELFRAERYGNFAYAIPVPPGVYSLTLYFTEAMFVPSAASTICRGPGCRVFDVTCNGVTLLREFDVFATAGGPFLPVTRTFHGLRPNGQGKLLLTFSPSVNYAEVRAIEVLDETPQAR